MNEQWIARGSLLGALLCAIAQGCGDDSAADESGAGETSCQGTTEELVTVSADAVADLEVVDGDYPQASCEVFCAGHFDEFFPLIGCGPSPDGATTGGADEGTGSADTTAGSSGGSSTGDLGDVTVTCHVTSDVCGTPGRLSGALESRGGAGDSTGAWFATMAHAEAASVVSFVRLAATLVAHDAPAELVARCRAAARDEARHAQVMARHARVHGVAPTRPPRS
jgi:hypothetical protein